MIRRIIIAITVVTATALAMAAAMAAAAARVPDCEWETGEGQAACVWHADRQGDGRGDSLLLVAGQPVARW